MAANKIGTGILLVFFGKPISVQDLYARGACLGVPKNQFQNFHVAIHTTHYLKQVFDNFALILPDKTAKELR